MGRMGKNKEATNRYSPKQITIRYRNHLVITGIRMENEFEYVERIKKEQEKNAERLARGKKLQEIKEHKERAEYERLKKKYENEST